MMIATVSDGLMVVREQILQRQYRVVVREQERKEIAEANAYQI